MKVLRTEALDGTKFFLANPACVDKPNAAETWLLLPRLGHRTAAAPVLRELFGRLRGANTVGGKGVCNRDGATA